MPALQNLSFGALLSQFPECTFASHCHITLYMMYQSSRHLGTKHRAFVESAAGQSKQKIKITAVAVTPTMSSAYPVPGSTLSTLYTSFYLILVSLLGRV